MLIVVTWFWGTKYGTGYVEKLSASVGRHLNQPHKFAVISEGARIRIPAAQSWAIKDEELTKYPGCFARLRMFDPEWQVAHGVMPGDRLVCIDLDTVIVGPLDVLFDRPEPFVILQGGNASNPCPYGGALMVLRAGQHPDVFSDFSLSSARKVPYDSFPDDQGWLWHKIPKAAAWNVGPESGAYVFRKPGWPGWADKKESISDSLLPDGARLVTFSGWRNPKRFEHLEWVKQHWHA